MLHAAGWAGIFELTIRNRLRTAVKSAAKERGKDKHKPTEYEQRVYILHYIESRWRPMAHKWFFEEVPPEEREKDWWKRDLRRARTELYESALT